ncbi:hypothetical protein Tco_0974930 [Tanacetum coccineum]|uniref:Uncharacterized protein n=1 Tax=Tanacetum coccineum TaxID=301880 RepID=A0ABQ5ED99_9ASTR
MTEKDEEKTAFITYPMGYSVNTKCTFGPKEYPGQPINRLVDQSIPKQTNLVAAIVTGALRYRQNLLSAHPPQKTA